MTRKGGGKDKEEKEQQEACFLWTGQRRSVTEADLRRGETQGELTRGSLLARSWGAFPWMTESCSVVSDSLRPHGVYSPWNSPGQNTGVGSLFLLQGIFPTQEFNQGLLHCRWIPYQLSHKGSPRITEWVAYPFSSRSSQPRNWTRVSCIEWLRVLTRKTS